jgi:hypothetical protein
MRQRAFVIGRPYAAKTVVDTLVSDNMPPLEVTDDDAEAIILAASKERDLKTLRP